ncbi:zinc/iron-chelating domain-containing protein [Desulfogranum mediterraneum]|uniref:zinc/iron-chelating domain-containing protein n=1 Tax=Desulfogranum mediterraneum TaxID=160661 RepID=UPI00068403BE|nr:zinc/iron-chelating domain-containing protein [Desulfogranum mediterraneum]
MKTKTKSQCDRCGQCCLQGGPALHTQDLELIRQGRLSFADLVTVRRGELALPPLGSEAEPVAAEFIKLQGHGGSWSCRFFAKQGAAGACQIYQYRPLACRVLECSSPEALLTITGKHLLSRFDCMDEQEPLLPLIREHEERCSCPELATVREQWADEQQRSEILAAIQELVDLDLQYRCAAARHFALPVERELFYFGRPLFQLLAATLGVSPLQEGERIILQQA